jgi:hypothetical protein
LGGTDTLKDLLPFNGHQLALTESFLEAAAGNTVSGERYLELMIRHRKQFEITNRIVCAAAQNKTCGDKTI